MPCVRCGGLLIEHWWDFVNDVSQRKLSDTRGVNGGAIEDSGILANRLGARHARIVDVLEVGSDGRHGLNRL
jgi:hypothetical protein